MSQADDFKPMLRGISLPIENRPDIAGDRRLGILGVEIADVHMSRALEIVREMIEQYDGRTRGIYFVNAHALNLAASDCAYHDVLNAGDYVFGDGTGVR